MNVIGEFEIFFLTTLFLSILFLGLNIFSLGLFVYRFYRNRNKEEIEDKNFLKKLKGYKIYHLAAANCVLLITILVLLDFLFGPGAQVVKTYPSQESFLDSYTKPITILFDRPIKKEDLQINMSEDIEGDWEYEKSISWLPFVRQIKFTPKESFFPDENIKIYLVNFNKQDVGEYPLDFYSAKLPKIVGITPSDLSKDVMTDTDITILLDKNTDNYVDWEFEITPKVEFETKEIDKNEYKLTPKEKLKQTTKYTISAYRTAQKYNIKTGEVVGQGEKVKVHESSFSTVKAPLIESFKPVGLSVLPDEVIEVVFDEPMNQADVESSFSIEPETSGTSEWLDERTFRFTPEALEKETAYKVTFAKGIRSKSGGTVEDDVVFEFETIGKVKVAWITPTGGAQNIDINTSITVGFDQEVDHNSAIDHFSVSPTINGNFTWTDNKTLVFKPSSTLSYNTTYNVTLSPGVKTVHGLDSVENFQYGFTTRDNTFILSVNRIVQSNSFGCNAAATAMILNYKGRSVGEYDVINNAGSGPQGTRASGANPHKGWVSDYGLYWEPIISYAQSLGLSAQVHQNWNITDMLKEVQKGNPVLVWWQNGVSGSYPISWTASDGTSIFAVHGMHAGVVIGYKGTPEAPIEIYFLDSWWYSGIATRTVNTFDYFWSTWNGNSVPADYKRVGLVIK